MRGCYLLCWLLLSGIESRCQVRDSVFLYNGQVLIGEVINLQLGVLSLDDLDLKDLTVKVYKIRALHTQRRYKIELTDKEVFYGYLKGGGRDGWIEVVLDDGTTMPVEMSKLHQVTPLEKRFLRNLHGNLAAGFSYTKSSGLGQINLSSSVLYTGRKFDYQVNASANASIDSSTFSRDREDVALFAGYLFTSTWFLAGNFSYQRNLELSIARRYQEMIGAGNKFFVRDTWQLMGITGLSFNQELSTSKASSGLLLEIPVMVRFNFFQFKQPKIQISTQQTTYFSLSQQGRIRFEGNTSFSWQLIRYFYVTLNPYTNYDNQPPSGGNRYDYGVVLSVTYKF